MIVVAPVEKHVPSKAKKSANVTSNAKLALPVVTGKTRMRKIVNMSAEDSKSEEEEETACAVSRPPRKNSREALSEKKNVYAKKSFVIPAYVEEKENVSQDEDFSENSAEALKLAIKTLTKKTQNTSPEQATRKLKMPFAAIRMIAHAQDLPIAAKPALEDSEKVDKKVEKMVVQPSMQSQEDGPVICGDEMQCVLPSLRGKRKSSQLASDTGIDSIPVK